MLVSFQLASKYPQNLVALCDNLEQSANDPSCFELLVKIDVEDPKMQAAVAAEVPRRKFRLRPLVTPRRRGYEDLWQALNELCHLTDPQAYFVCNINDEIRIREQGWDERLRRYIGLFPDDIFRLRTSRLKFRNYYDFWECGFAPEGLAFFTKRWLDICGDWNPCFGPDSSQQYIAYYLGYGNYPSIKQYNRDVPILDISWRNEGVGLNLTSAEQYRRTAINFRLWNRQVSHPMQEELFRRARLLQAHIMQAEAASLCSVKIEDNRAKRMILLRDATDGALLDLLPYKISRTAHFFRNLRRRLRFTYSGGGGRDARNIWAFSTLEYLTLRYPSFRRFLIAPSQWFAAGRNQLTVMAQGAASSIKRATSPIKLAWDAVCRTGQGGFRSLGAHAHALGGAFANVLRSLASAVGRLFLGIGLIAYGLVRRLPRPAHESLWRLVGEPFRRLVGFVREPWSVRKVAEPADSQIAGVLSSVLRTSAGAIRKLGTAIVWLLGAPWWALSTFLRALSAFTQRIGRRFATLFSVGVWRFYGNRFSLALMDRDWRWLNIKESDKRKIGPIRDPWFDPPPKLVQNTRDDHQVVPLKEATSMPSVASTQASTVS